MLKIIKWLKKKDKNSKNNYKSMLLHLNNFFEEIYDV